MLASCRLDAAVDVFVEDDGRGTVEVAATVDPDALERIGGDLGAVLEADDLEAAGWEVSISEPTEVRLRRPFDDAAEANAILAGLSGPDGPLRGLAVAEDTLLRAHRVVLRRHDRLQRRDRGVRGRGPGRGARR